MWQLKNVHPGLDWVDSSSAGLLQVIYYVNFWAKKPWCMRVCVKSDKNSKFCHYFCWPHSTYKGVATCFWVALQVVLNIFILANRLRQINCCAGFTGWIVLFGIRLQHSVSQPSIARSRTHSLTQSLHSFLPWALSRHICKGEVLISHVQRLGEALWRWTAGVCVSCTYRLQPKISSLAVMAMPRGSHTPDTVLTVGGLGGTNFFHFFSPFFKFLILYVPLRIGSALQD